MKFAGLISTLLTFLSTAIFGQLPIKTDFVHFVEGADGLHCAIDPISEKVFFSATDPDQGGNEFLYEVSPEGRALTLEPQFMGELVGNNKIMNLAAYDDNTYLYGLHQMSSPTRLWSKLYTENDTLRYPDSEQSFSIAYDMHFDQNRIFACGQLNDTNFIFSSDLNAQLLWDTTMAANFALTSITSIGDTVYTFKHPTLYKFNAITGQLINFTNAGGAGQGDCDNHDGALFWACSSGPQLYWAKHIPDVGDVWWNDMTMNGNFKTVGVQVDSMGRMWVAGNDDDGGHLIIFDVNGNPTDHQYGKFISDIVIENGRVAICGGLKSSSSNNKDLKYLIVGTVQ